jgi:hypothetical protein
VACLGKLGAISGWFAVRAIQRAVDNEPGTAPPISPEGYLPHDSDCAFGWASVASAAAVIVAAAFAFTTRTSPRCYVTRMVTRNLAAKNLNYGAIHDAIFRHRAASANHHAGMKKRASARASGMVDGSRSYRAGGLLGGSQSAVSVPPAFLHIYSRAVGFVGIVWVHCNAETSACCRPSLNCVGVRVTV